jgi:hypothetical protein
MGPQLQKYRVAYTLILGFWARVESGAVTVPLDFRPQTDGMKQDTRIYDAVLAAVNPRITSTRYRLIIGPWCPVNGAPVLDTADYLAQVKE